MSDPHPDQPVPPTPLGHTPVERADGRGGAVTRASTLVAEAFGSLLLVTAIVGAGLFAAHPPAVSGDGAVTPLAGDVLTTALAAGFALVAASYAFGPISGGHFNPAVTVGLAAAGRFPWPRVLPYVAAQTIGALTATTLLVLMALFGPAGWLTAAQDRGFSSNGFGTHSPGAFDLGAAIVAELLFSALLVLVILGATHTTRGSRFAGLTIGLALALIHIVLIPLDNAGVNPARSLATALYGGVPALAQLWVFLVLPLVGALLAGVAHRALFEAPGPR